MTCDLCEMIVGHTTTDGGESIDSDVYCTRVATHLYEYTKCCNECAEEMRSEGFVVTPIKTTKKICNANETNCPCGLKPAPEGHDGCLGTIDGVMNACCGHLGFGDGAYIQYGALVSGRWEESSTLRGKDALAEFARLGIGPDVSKWDDRPCECRSCDKDESSDE